MKKGVKGVNLDIWINKHFLRSGNKISISCEAANKKYFISYTIQVNKYIIQYKLHNTIRYDNTNTGYINTSYINIFYI